jgi:hypothetical protein
MMGSRGQVRMRLHPKRYGRGPRGIVGKRGKLAERKAELDRKHKFEFEKPKARSSLVRRLGTFFNQKFIKPRGNR